MVCDGGVVRAAGGVLDDGCPGGAAMTAPRCTCSKFSNYPDRWCEKHGGFVWELAEERTDRMGRFVRKTSVYNAVGYAGYALDPNGFAFSYEVDESYEDWLK